jgi:selenocysteine lyase/cysteine desulfurase
VFSNARSKTPTELFRIADVADEDAYRYFASQNVNAPASSFYAVECSRHLGLGDDGAIRAGLAPYNTLAEVDRLLDCVAELASR